MLKVKINNEYEIKNKIDFELKLDYNDILIKPIKSSLSSRNEVNLERSFYFPKSHQNWHGIPIIASNMDLVGTYEVYEILSKFKILTAFHKFYTKDEYLKMNLNKEYFMVSTGINDVDFDRLKDILDNIDVKFICIDVANGYMTKLIEFCIKIRTLYPNKVLVAGNIVCKELTKELLSIGVDIVKCGIGSGSACTTRIKTGVGIPQISTNLECSKEAHKNEGYIIADGGITCAGDLGKAFASGADFVMIGGQFAGHDENPGNIIEENGQKYKLFYGMSSSTAMNNYYGNVNKYRTSEGRTVKIKYKGKLEDTVLDYLGGLRSTCTYTNTKSVEDLFKNVSFVRVNNQYNKIFT
jgi:GMP reductase